MKKMIVRQGDVLLVQISVEESDLTDVTADARGNVLAEGETSGHYHALFGSGAKLMRYKSSPEKLVALVDEGGEVRVIGGGSGGVDRHVPVSLTPGRYEVRLQKAWDSSKASRNED